LSHRLAFPLAALLVATHASVSAQTAPPPQTPAQTNDTLAQLGRFQQPPPPQPVVPLNAAPPPAGNSNGQTPRRQWRELTDALLELMGPRTLIAGKILDDPLTIGFGNHDYNEPLLLPEPARAVAAEPDQ
jgi:hypothetical protein